jgi:hypothetical protein
MELKSRRLDNELKRAKLERLRNAPLPREEPSGLNNLPINEEVHIGEQPLVVKEACLLWPSLPRFQIVATADDKARRDKLENQNPNLKIKKFTPPYLITNFVFTYSCTSSTLDPPSTRLVESIPRMISSHLAAQSRHLQLPQQPPQKSPTVRHSVNGPRAGLSRHFLHAFRVRIPRDCISIALMYDGRPELNCSSVILPVRISTSIEGRSDASF